MYVRVFERLGQLQDIEEQGREFKEPKSRFAVAKKENAKPLSPLLGDVLPQGALKRAGLTTTTWVDNKLPSLIQSVLEQSRVLKPFIAAKLILTTTPKTFVLHRSDPGFNQKYLTLHKIAVPFSSREEKDLLNIRGFYHRPTDSIHLRPSTNIGQALQLAITRFSPPAFRNFFGQSLTDGLGLYFTNLVLVEQGLARMIPDLYKDQLRCATDLVGVVGLSLAAQAYFQKFSPLLRYLTTNLLVRRKDIVGDALCKMPLSRWASLPKEERKKLRSIRFFAEYDLRFGPDIPRNPGMTRDEKDKRIKDVNAMVKELVRRRDKRAKDALKGVVTKAEEVRSDLVDLTRRLSTGQIILFHEFFPDGPGGINLNDFQESFEQFNNGELRNRKIRGEREPNGGFEFLFAEFAFLCVDSNIARDVWSKLLMVFVQTQEIFIHVYRPPPYGKPPHVDAPPPPCLVDVLRNPLPRRSLDAFNDGHFKEDGQSTPGRKAALRAKYARMDVTALGQAAQQNLLRAQCMA